METARILKLLEMPYSNQSYSDDTLNITVETLVNATVQTLVNGTASGNRKHVSTMEQVIITTVYFGALVGNLLALVLLWKKNTRPRNAKHRLMLRSLAVNDLVAVLGMMSLMYIQLYVKDLDNNIWYCRFRVAWRSFGLGSGCVAIVMAVERWLALTKPFFYQKYVTVKLIGQSIFSLWALALILACLPILGFGLYFENNKCARYRDAKLPKDVAYAYLFFSLGSLLCIGIAYCNLAVRRALFNKPHFLIDKKNKTSVLMRRVSRNCSKTSNNTLTKEEVAFGRIMAFLCMIYIVCWMPQLASIIIVQIYPERRNRYRFADMLLALHFLLDPFVYVLQRSVLRVIFYPRTRLTFQTKSSISTPSEQTFYIPVND